MRKIALTSCLLAALAGPLSARDTGYYSKLDLPLYPGQRRAQHPGKFDRLYLGSPRSYAAEPKEVVVAGKTMNLGLAAAGLSQARDPLSAAGFFLIGLINARDLRAALRDKSAPASGWSFLWSKDKP